MNTQCGSPGLSYGSVTLNKLLQSSEKQIHVCVVMLDVGKV